MEIFSALLALCAGIHRSPPVTRSFGAFFDMRLNKRLGKQWRGWWFEKPSRPLWRHCNGCYLAKQLILEKQIHKSQNCSVITKKAMRLIEMITLRWRHNERDSVWNHQPHDCLLKRLFRRRSKKISKICVTGLCVGNSPATGEFPAQMASNAENVVWWRHHELSQRMIK